MFGNYPQIQNRKKLFQQAHNSNSPSKTTINLKDENSEKKSSGDRPWASKMKG